MKIEVTNYEENEEGGAVSTFELDQEAIRFLVEKGVNAILKEALDNFEKEIKNEVSTQIEVMNFVALPPTDLDFQHRTMLLNLCAKVF